VIAVQISELILNVDIGWVGAKHSADILWVVPKINDRMLRPYLQDAGYTNSLNSSYSESLKDGRSRC
jgi:hypothetical protein